MAYVQELPDGALDTIVKQVGRLYPSLDNKVAECQPSAELTETFPVWFLSADRIDTGSDNLLEIAQDTDRWHSQIWIDGEPRGVAHFIAPDEDTSDWTVTQVLKGDLAKTVDDAIDWVDTKVETDPSVRLLEVPSLFITALWLINEQESSVVIARLPENLQNLSPLVQYSSQDFLKALRQEPRVIGIRPERSRLPNPRERTASEQKIFKVLSISGDGIDDIVPAMILAKIEEEIGLSTADSFDFITGKSTGRVLALGLSTRGDNGEPEYKARDFVNIYENLRNRIFNFFNEDVDSCVMKRFSPEMGHTEPGHFYPGVGSVLSSYFQNTAFANFENVLGYYFRGTALGDVLKETKTMVAHYDIGIGAWPRLFSESRELKHVPPGIWRAISRQSAAPTFFSPITSVYAGTKEIMSLTEPFKGFQDSDIFVLSLGNAQATIDLQELSSLGYNCVSLHTPVSEIEGYVDSASGDNITDHRSLANELIQSAEFHKACNQLKSVV